MKVKIFLEVLLAIIYTCQSSTLVVDVIEIRSIDSNIFLCNKPSSSTNLTRWTYLNGPPGTSLMSYQNGRCTVSPSDSFLTNSIRYTFTCNNIAYQVTIEPNTAQSRHNHILSCKDAYQLDSTGYTWIIKTKANERCSYCEPTMTFDVKEITEGFNVTFICRVSSDVPYVNWNMLGSNTAAMSVQNGQCDTSPSGTTFLDDTSKYIYTCNTTVYQVTKLNVQRNEHNDIYMCSSKDQKEGTGSNWIIKVVKAQVASVTITSPPDSLVYVKENTIVNFTCTTSTARPAASVYWYRHLHGQSSYKTKITSNVTTTTDYNDLSISTSILSLFVTRQDNNIKVFCTANNAVNRTELRSTSKRQLNVLYTSDDPYIVNGREYRVVENTQGTLSCTVRGGNPTPTLSWSCTTFPPANQSITKSNENVTSTLMWNVSRNHDGTCTCKSHQTGFEDKSVDVRLVVLYEANIKLFTINGLDDISVTVNENGKVDFNCTADSNPEAVMTFNHQSKILETVTSNKIEYSIAKARCSDVGTYNCSATNKHIDEKVSAQIIKLLVKCAPRVAGEVNTNITSAKNVSKTITVNVIAYPPPAFTWNQLMNGVWTSLDKNNKFAISSSSAQSNLTIRSVGLADFTKYRVIVKNKVGEMEQNFTLSPYGFPDTPTELKHIESQTTTSSIHIEWKPGYNGGPTQTFYIKYKQSSESTWTYFTVIDNGEVTMDISLTSLVEKTQYDIVIFASNIIGNSSESQVLVASTEASSTGPLVGGIAGGVTVCIIIVIVVIVIIRRYKSSDGLVDNAMYESSSPVARPASPSSDVKADLVKRDINGSNDLYAQVQKTKTKDSAAKGYESVDVNTDKNKKSNMKKTPQVKATTNESKRSNINQDGLNYADLEFNGSQPVEKKKIEVYEPTPYDVVDFTKKAEPLPDSDEEDNK